MIRNLQKIWTTLFLVILYSLHSFGQDSTATILDSAKIYFFYNNFETKGPDFINKIDTLITNVEKYDPPAKAGNYHATLGNPGLAHVNMVYSPSIYSGFNFGIHSFDKYMFFNDSVHHYWVGKPYTHLFFIQGAKKQQNIRVDHSQNVASWFNVGVRFRYVNSPGFYTNQESDDKNFVFKTRFQTRNYRYMVLANYIHNKLEIEENGGILYDTVFEDNISPDRRGVEVKLQNAKNYYKENSYYIKQFFKLSNSPRFRSEDSTGNNSFFNRGNMGNISLSTLLSQKTYLYEQPTSDNVGFYPFTYDSVNPTYDSTYFWSIENQLAWTNADNSKNKLLTLNFKFRHIYTELSVDSVNFKYAMLIPTGELNFKVSDVLKLYFLADFITGNTYGGDFNLLGKLSLKTKFGSLNYEMQNANQEPGRFYMFYRSNHYRWNNNELFKKQYFFINKVNFRYKTFDAGVNIYAVQNFTYLDSIGYPKQLQSNLQVLQLYARKLFKLGNWSLDGRVIYQKGSNEKGIRVPEFIGDASVYYTKDLFKQAAIVQTGVDVFYNTAYNAYGYNPATRGFQIQNEKQVGNYVYANIFLTLQVKRAKIFIKYNNLGYLFSEFRYLTVPSYPMQDGSINWGVSWMFYD